MDKQIIEIIKALIVLYNDIRFVQNSFYLSKNIYDKYIFNKELSKYFDYYNFLNNNYFIKNYIFIVNELNRYFND